ncbi:MAG TPA: hypothetical protein VK730_04585 [Solirubrobacteraceae bacterium]|nr:hypothetical protein [Solirubrobacteraceae bacterium]
MAGEGEHEHASTEELFESILQDIATRAFEGHTEDEIERVVASGRLGKAVQETIPEVSKQLADKLVATAPQMLAKGPAPSPSLRRKSGARTGRG